MNVRGNFSGRVGRHLTAVAAAGVMLAAWGASCGGESRALLLVDVTGDHLYQGVNVTLTANGVTTKTFHNATFSDSIVFEVGLYVTDAPGGQVTVTAAIDDGQCLTGQGQALFTGVKLGGTATANGLFVHRVDSSTCVPIQTGTGGQGIGGAPGIGGGGGVPAGIGGAFGLGGFNNGGLGGFNGGGLGGFNGGGVGGFNGGGLGGTGVGGGNVGIGGGLITGTGGKTGVGGGAGGDPACAIVICPSSLPSCCSAWYSFGIDYSGTTVPGAVSNYQDTSSGVSADFNFTVTPSGREIIALGLDLKSPTTVSGVRLLASQTGGMPIYVSFENATSSVRCMYGFDTDGTYLVSQSSPFDYLGSCSGSFTKINVRMDSTTSGTANLAISSLQIFP